MGFFMAAGALRRRRGGASRLGLLPAFLVALLVRCFRDVDVRAAVGWLRDTPLLYLCSVVGVVNDWNVE